MSSGPTDRPVLRAAGHRALFASVVTVLVLALHTVHVRDAAADGRVPPARPGHAAATSAVPHPGRATRTPPPTRAARAGAAASASVVPTAHLTSAPAGGVFVVGDSLALGSAPYLHTVFTPAAVEQDLREGRGTAEGARVVAAHGGDGVIVASLGTNDDPRTQIFRPAAEALVAAARGRCLVWATVARPGDVDGVRWSNVNAIIREEAAAHPNVVVVDWAAEQSAHPSWVEGDDVHLTDAGYQARAAALASGVTRCS